MVFAAQLAKVECEAEASEGEYRLEMLRTQLAAAMPTSTIGTEDGMAEFVFFGGRGFRVSGRKRQAVVQSRGTLIANQGAL